MAEAGGPTIAEIQAKPAGVVEKVKHKLREMFTPIGRAEVMAQKQMDTILAQVAPEDRVKAMEHLEKMRPDLVASNLPGAKDRLVKEAVVGAAAFGTLLVGGTLAYVKRDAIMDAAFSMGVPKVTNKDHAMAHSIRDTLIKGRKAKFGESIQKATDPVKRFIDGMNLWPFNKLDANPSEAAPPPQRKSHRILEVGKQ